MKKSNSETALRLPQDIIEEILSRLPVSSLNRLRFVSKSFRSLITSPSFANLHFNRSSQQRILTSSTTDGFRLLGTSICKEIRPDPPPETKNYPVMIMGSCRGLVALFSLNLNKDFLLWNPSTGEYKKLPDPGLRAIMRPYSHYDLRNNKRLYESYFSFHGLGYDSSTDDYKVVYGVEESESGHKVFIFSLRKNSWRMIESPRIDPEPINRNESGCVVNGALHWALGRLKSSASQIFALDLKTERFSIIPQNPRPLHCNLINIGVVDGRLCSTYFTRRIDHNRPLRRSYCIETWVMQEYGVKESWANLFCVAEESNNDGFYKRCCILKNHHILGANGRLDSLRYDPERGSIVETCKICPYCYSHIDCGQCEAILVTDTLFSPNVLQQQNQRTIEDMKKLSLT